MTEGSALTMGHEADSLPRSTLDWFTSVSTRTLGEHEHGLCHGQWLDLIMGFTKKNDGRSTRNIRKGSFNGIFTMRNGDLIGYL